MADWQFDIDANGIVERGPNYVAVGVVRDEAGSVVGDLDNHEFAVSKQDVLSHMAEFDVELEEALETCFSKMLRDLKRSRGVDLTPITLGPAPASFKNTKLKSNLSEVRKRATGQGRPVASPRG